MLNCFKYVCFFAMLHNIKLIKTNLTAYFVQLLNMFDKVIIRPLFVLTKILSKIQLILM